MDGSPTPQRKSSVTTKSKKTTRSNDRIAAAPENDGSRPPASKKREREIIDAAAEIFCRQGYADTSVQDVADAVGILKGSLYYYIKSKEDLLFRVLEEVHEDAHGIVDEVDAMEELPPLGRLYAYLQRHVQYNTRNLTKIAVYYHDFGLLSPERREIITKQRTHYERFVVGLIEEAQAAGDVAPGLDSKVVAYSILGMVNWVYTWYRPRGKTSPEELGTLVAEMIVNGLRGADPERVALSRRTGRGRTRRAS